jgi:glutamate dehydrogenase
LAIIPPTSLKNLFINKKLSARELMYSFSALKFAYYFSHRESDEYIQLSKSLSSDPINLNRLININKRFKKDSITEARIEDCIVEYLDILIEIYKDFENNCKRDSYPQYNNEIHKKIESKCHDEIDKLILKSFLIFNSCIVKTNFFKFQKSAISFRLDTSFLKPLIPLVYSDLPFTVFLVIGSDFMGFHVRMCDVAR